MGYFEYQVVQDFSHQQYHSKFRWGRWRQRSAGWFTQCRKINHLRHQQCNADSGRGNMVKDHDLLNLKFRNLGFVWFWDSHDQSNWCRMFGLVIHGISKWCQVIFSSIAHMCFFFNHVFSTTVMDNGWFGVGGVDSWDPLWKGLLLGTTPRIPNHQAPNHQIDHYIVDFFSKPLEGSISLASPRTWLGDGKQCLQ